MPDVSRVERLGGGRVRYRGRVFPGFNKPKVAKHPRYKQEVLARKGNQFKLLGYGHRSYSHNYSPRAKKNYLTRSAGIRNKNGQLTKDDVFSRNYWARRKLWPKNKPTTSQKRRRRANMSRLNNAVRYLRHRLNMATFSYNNRFLAGLAEAVKKTGKLPSRGAMLKLGIKHPVGFYKTMKQVDHDAVTAGMLKTGKGRYGQAWLGAKKAANTPTGKDLVVNTGGFIGSSIGGAVGGTPASLVGDNLGAVTTRKVINRGYAGARARAKLGAGAPKTAVRAKTKRIAKALDRLDRMQGNRISDQIGWGVGNTVAQSTSGVPIPLRGGMVAMRTVPELTRNAQKVMRGELKPQQYLSQSAADIAKRNNVKKMARKGNARERLARQRVNKIIRESGMV